MIGMGQGNQASAMLLTPAEREQSAVVADPSKPDMPIIFVSDEFEAQTGYAADEVLGRNCRFLQGPETDPATVQIIREALAEQATLTIDILNYRKNGTKFWNRLRLRPLYSEQSDMVFYAGAQTVIDATEVRFGGFPGVRD
ncbi:MAG: PAS domain-containing protein [Geminicoccaceae bacterium]